jgi:hydrogenase expression/formation protein HypC
MCLAVPGRVTSIDGLQAVVDMGGVQRIIGLALTPEAQVGDFVHVHAGYAISVVDEEMALESLRLLRELAEAYPEESNHDVTGKQLPPPGA